MTTVFLHNVTSASIERHQNENDGRPYHVTKIVGVDSKGHEFDVSLFSDQPLTLPEKPVAYENVDDEIESRR